MNKNKLKISSKAFWDVNFEKLMQQYDYYPEFIIKKVFEYGTFQDVLSVYKYFGKQTVTDTLLNVTYMPKKKLHFASEFLKINKTNFRCYINKRQRRSYTKH